MGLQKDVVVGQDFMVQVVLKMGSGIAWALGTLDVDDSIGFQGLSTDCTCRRNHVPDACFAVAASART